MIPKKCKGSADSSVICVNNECASKSNIANKKWAVDIVVPSLDPSSVSTDEIAFEVSERSNIIWSECFLF